MKLICKITDSDFGFKKKKCVFKKRRAARVVLLHKNKVALLNISGFGYFSLPGGGIKPKESIRSALIREVKEETGCSLKGIKILGRIVEKRTHTRLNQVSYCFLARVSKFGKHNFTEKELKSGTKLVWVSINKVFQKFEHIKKFGYQERFVTKRAIIIIKEAFKKLKVVD